MMAIGGTHLLLSEIHGRLEENRKENIFLSRLAQSLERLDAAEQDGDDDEIEEDEFPRIKWDMEMKYEFLVEWCDLCNEPTWYTGHQDIMLSHPHQDRVHLVSPAGKGDILRSGVTYKTRHTVSDSGVQVAVIGVM